MSAIGHNTVAGNQLKAIVERIERLEDEKSATASDIRDVYAESKANGFDVKALRAVIGRRKQDAKALSAHESIVETYMNALGQLAGTPLGQSAMERAGVPQS